MRARQLLIGTVVAVLVMAAGSAAATLPLRSSPFVRLVRIRGGATVKLTARGRTALRPLLRGAQLTSDCTHLVSSPDGDVPGSGTAAEQGYTDSHGHSHVVTVLDVHADFCSISLDYHAANITTVGPGGPPFAAIAFTRRGAIFLEADRVTAQLMSILRVAEELARKDGGTDPTAPALNAFTHGTLAVLTNPQDTPPPGRLGVYSDGQHHVEVVGVAALGQRLYVDENAGVFSTNDATHVFRVAGLQAATFGG